MGIKMDELAAEIATLDPAEQGALWEKVADLNFQRGLEHLSQKIRARLEYGAPHCQDSFEGKLR